MREYKFATIAEHNFEQTETEKDLTERVQNDPRFFWHGGATVLLVFALHLTSDVHLCRPKVRAVNCWDSNSPIFREGPKVHQSDLLPSFCLRACLGSRCLVLPNSLQTS